MPPPAGRRALQAGKVQRQPGTVNLEQRIRTRGPLKLGPLLNGGPAAGGMHPEIARHHRRKLRRDGGCPNYA